MQLLETKFDKEAVLNALRATCLVVRGPKPAAVLREWSVPFQHQVREPNTWREVIELLDEKLPVANKTVAIQEYGTSNQAFLDALQQRGAKLTALPVYQWALPEDTAPLISAIQAIMAAKVDVLLFTSSYQLRAVLDVAASIGIPRDQWIAAANRLVIGSVGPTCTETLKAEGLYVDIQPEHPKLGHLIAETARSALSICQNFIAFREPEIGSEPVRETGTGYFGSEIW